MLTVWLKAWRYQIRSTKDNQIYTQIQETGNKSPECVFRNFMITNSTCLIRLSAPALPRKPSPKATDPFTSLLKTRLRFCAEFNSQ